VVSKVNWGDKTMAEVKFNNLEKVYSNGFKAVHNIDLTIRDGEFLVIVGPSGCAKSTTLRMLAGLENISGGDITIGGKVVNNLAPKDRGIAMVFQNYALYPHMTVRQNLGFGLKLQKLPVDEINARVNEAAKVLEIEDLLDRLPRQLSGGQAQRVAVGRAIVKKPDVFLFDEPLSNLDAKLRASMRVRISDLHKHLKAENRPATAVYVTHDQTEAMTMGDRICVMKLGEIMQVDTPEELYNNPVNMFVAGFIGAPEMNLVDAQVEDQNGTLTVNLAGQTLAIPAAKAENIRTQRYHNTVLGIRPDNITLALAEPQSPEIQTITGDVIRMENMGHEVFVYFQVGKHELTARVPIDDVKARLGMTLCKDVTFMVDMNKAHIFDKETERNISLKQ
jgi:oligogalacturonide transport system ATP-binding protein